jgi:hypothetical protein
MQITQIAELLSCAIATVRVYLKKWGTFISYNRNGSYGMFAQHPRREKLLQDVVRHSVVNIR